MVDWVLTAGLQNLRRQVNARWPGRDTTSDGSIGNYEHSLHPSGHNPDDTPGSRPAWDGDSDSIPEVRAWDMDSDLNESGTTAQMVVDHICRLPNVATVIRYMIYNRTMYHSRDGFASTPYDGASAHTEHVHFEGAWSQAADNNTSYDYRLDEVREVAEVDLTPAATLEVRKQDAFGLYDALWSAAKGVDVKNRDGSIRVPYDGVGDAIKDNLRALVVAPVLAAIASIPGVDENALGAAIAASLLNPLREAILSGLPEGALTKEDVAQVVEDAIEDVRLTVTPAS
jgi:hypothetical protein